MCPMMSPRGEGETLVRVSMSVDGCLAPARDSLVPPPGGEPDATLSNPIGEGLEVRQGEGEPLLGMHDCG